MKYILFLNVWYLFKLKLYCISIFAIKKYKNSLAFNNIYD